MERSAFLLRLISICEMDVAGKMVNDQETKGPVQHAEKNP